MFAGVCLSNIWNILIFIFGCCISCIFSYSNLFDLIEEFFRLHIFFYLKVTVSIFKSECDKALNVGGANQKKKKREKKIIHKEGK